MRTTTLLGSLLTEQIQHDEVEQPVAGPRSRTLFRPEQVGLRNDGFRGYWMARGQEYTVGHDGVGWRVVCRDWTDGHVLRLVDSRDGREFVDTLLTDQGILALEEGRIYEIREVEPMGAWGIYAR